MKRFCIIITLWPLVSFGQYGPLDVGDKLPQPAIALINNILSEEGMNNTSLKDKGIILDFFATWCTACIRSLPHFDSLQKQYGDELQIIIVTAEPPEKIEAFRKKNKVFAGCTLPIVTNDSLFRKLFPHKLIPHEVWISKETLVKAVTDDKEITAMNIQTFLAGKALHITMKKDILEFDLHQPFPANEMPLLYSSVLTAELEGVASSQGMDYTPDSSGKRFFYINRPLRSLFAAAGVNDNTNKTLYCYELTVPVSFSIRQVKEWMRLDLDRYFSQP